MLKIITVLSALVSLAANAFIIYYLHQLKYSPKCSTCDTSDWRHNTVFGITIYNMLATIANVVFVLMDKKLVNYLHPNLVITIAFSNFIVASILVFSLFTYIQLQDKNQCDCIKDGHLFHVHRFVNVWRYVILVSFLLVILIPLIVLFVQLIKLSLAKQK